jgi:hypothetical protein
MAGIKYNMCILSDLKIFLGNSEIDAAAAPPVPLDL